MSSFNNFQTMLDQQVGTVPAVSGWPHVLPPSPASSSTDTSRQRRIPASSLRFQGAAWVTAGGGMATTLHGARRIFRNFRGFKYI